MEHQIGESGLGQGRGPDIFVSKSVIAQLQQVDLGKVSSPVEGLLGGQVVFSQFRPVLLIEHVFFYPLDQTPNLLSVDHWRRAQEMFADQYPEARILGWFALRFQGLDLTNADRARSAKLFGEHWQVCLLVDSDRKSWRIWSWQEGQLRPSRRVRALEAKSGLKAVEVSAQQTDVSSSVPNPKLPREELLTELFGQANLGPWFAAVAGILVILLIIFGAKALWNQRQPKFIDLLSQQQESVSVTAAVPGQGQAFDETVERPPQEILEAEPPITPAPDPGNRDVLSLPESGTEYTVYTGEPGDTLWRISEKLWGDGSRYQEIWKANPQISDPRKLQTGMALRIPQGSQGELLGD